MNYLESLKLALSNIWAHKLRSVLTLLGMIIGVAAFMTILSILLGFNKYVDEQIAGIGSNAFSIERFSFDDFKDGDAFAAAQRRNKELTLEELAYLRDHVRSISLVAAKANPNITDVKAGAEKLEGIPVDGMHSEIAEIEGLDANIEDGRFFNQAENDSSARVCFVGSEIARKLYPFGSAVGNEIQIRGEPFRIVGVQKEKGSVFGFSQDEFIYIPLKTYVSTFGPLRGSRSIYFEAVPASGVDIENAAEEVRQLMRMKRGLTVDEKDNFGIITPDTISGLRERIFGLIFIVIMVVPSIALVVGGIVIMNIMLVAVTERAKEIGLRKAVGANRRDILSQFLFESVTLTMIGGLAGFALALVAGQLISASVFPTHIPAWAVALGIAVPAGIGVVAGLYPAWTAARLDPIEALGRE